LPSASLVRFPWIGQMKALLIDEAVLLVVGARSPSGRSQSVAEIVRDKAVQCCSDSLRVHHLTAQKNAVELDKYDNRYCFF